jgi:hypothetical protein
MKNLVFCFLFLLSVSTLASQVIEPAPDDQSVVYFMRPGSTGGIINFVFFDGDQVIGRLGGNKYFRYECSQGEHVFWAKSENRSFLEANLEAGKIYIVHARSLMGATKASVQLRAIDPGVDKLKQFQKLLAKRSGWDLSEEKIDELNDQLESYKTKGLERFEELKAKGMLIDALEPDMNLEAEDLMFVKKKKGTKGI